jgi:hypothetical protein
MYINGHFNSRLSWMGIMGDVFKDAGRNNNKPRNRIGLNLIFPTIKASESSF